MKSHRMDEDKQPPNSPMIQINKIQAKTVWLVAKIRVSGSAGQRVSGSAGQRVAGPVCAMCHERARIAGPLPPAGLPA